MKYFTGSAVALITPFDSLGEVDWQAFDDLLTHHLTHQTDALVITGTTGEVSTLTDEEQIELIERAVLRCKGKKLVIAGTGINDTRHSIELSQAAERVGADMLLLVTPYYNKANEEGLFRHFTAIADSVNIPCILYHVPARTGTAMTPKQVAQLAQHPNIIGIKDATGDLNYTKEVINLTTEQEFYIYSGNDDLIADIMALGGKGVISVLANVLPDETHELCQLMLDGKTAEGYALQQEMMPLIEALFLEVNPIPVKYLLSQLRWNELIYRLPLWQPSDEVKHRLNQYISLASRYIKEAEK